MSYTTINIELRYTVNHSTPVYRLSNNGMVVVERRLRHDPDRYYVVESLTYLDNDASITLILENIWPDRGDVWIAWAETRDGDSGEPIDALVSYTTGSVTILCARR